MHKRVKQFINTVVLLLMATIAGLGPVGMAAASTIAHATVVSANPADWTPNVNDGAVYKVLEVGSTIYAGGSFTEVKKSGISFARKNLFSFSNVNGKLTTFAPTFDGAIWALATDGTSLFVGGEFKNVNGVARRGLAKFNLATGALDTSFNAGLSYGKVTEVAYLNGRLIIAGTFPKRLLAVNPTSGVDTGYMNLSISGSITPDAGSTQVYRFSINAAGTKLVGVGNFTSVSGQQRALALMVDLGTTSATLNPWNYKPLATVNPCRTTSVPDYLRDVDFAPDGSYFVIVAGGATADADKIGTALCDGASRFETTVTNPSKPTWINYTGGDTLHSVAVTGAAVYVQGHNRWLNNANGANSKGAGAVDRVGIGAIDPTTGLALSWNPGKDRGVGGKDFLVTSSGLWVASDTSMIAGETRKRLAFLSL